MPRVVLEQLALHHLPGLASTFADPESLRFTRLPNPPDPDFGPRWIATYDAMRAAGTREGFAALDDAGELVGLALVPEIDRVARQAELGYLVVPHARNRGYATAILVELTRWVFATLRTERAYLIIDLENTASIRVAERAGYTCEGVLRDMAVKPGLRSDCAIYARLASAADPRDHAAP